ncbi:MAG: amidoligase family protein [Oscillospiraceae bacterium]|nr:amidoligase family protein [Oscillospiraceae bacterium]
MTDKTATQIANMKQQTFGVEVEGNNITRQKAARVAAEYFGTGRFENTAYRNGYMTWSAWDQQGREWKFSKDTSISGPDDEKCELVTPILTYADMETFQELLRTLRRAGMKSSPSRGCGVHIHIGVKSLDGRNHDAKSLRNLANIMAAHESQIGRAIRIDRGRTGRYCRTVSPDFLRMLNSRKPETMRQLEDIWYKGNHADYGRNQHYNDSRYHMLNLHATFTKGTIEFRLFQFSDPHDGKQGGIHAGEMKAYIQLCLAMSELAKELAYASPRPQQTDNEKYAFRCWLLRLGFIGDEFATAREILLRNMDGNAAWRQAAC